VDKAWGIAPFKVSLRATVVSGYGFVDSACWDFDGDGLADASGITVSHRMSLPEDRLIKAWISTRNHGTLVREVTLSAYSALMSITFDDGHSSVITAALPVFKSRGITGTAYVVPTWIAPIRSAYMTWDDLDSLHRSGWDIGSHSMTHARLTEVADSVLHYELKESQVALQSRGFPARHFAVPYADYDTRVIDGIKTYYESNRIAGDLNPSLAKAKLYMLESHMSLAWNSLASYKADIDSAIEIGGWYILTNHEVRDDCRSRTWCIEKQRLSEIIDYAIQNRVKIVNIDEALAARKAGQWTPAQSAFGESPPQEAEPTGVSLMIACSRDLPHFAAITYELPKCAYVNLSVYSPRGRHIRTLANDYKPKGTHRVSWDGRDSSGSKMASGIYFLRIQAGERAATRKIMLVR
jgi:peptidoglycan/xylan/chitin deacetylase (PgdA/CDA1 family)